MSRPVESKGIAEPLEILGSTARCRVLRLLRA